MITSKPSCGTSATETPESDVLPGQQDGRRVDQDQYEVEPEDAGFENQSSRLFEDTGDSVYALSIKCLSDGTHRASALISLGTSVLLQLVLAGLVLYYAQNKENLNTNLQCSESDNLQMQLKVMQLQICSMEVAIQKFAAMQTNLTVFEFTRCADVMAELKSNATNSSVPVKCSALSPSAQATDIADFCKPALMQGLPCSLRTELKLAGTWERVMLLCVATFSLLVLGLFVTIELLEACELVYILCVLHGWFLPKWAGLEEARQAAPLKVRTWLRSSRWTFVLCQFVPALQIGVGCLVYAAGLVLLRHMEFTTNLLQIIVNSVALAFIIEVDNKMGDLLAWYLKKSSRWEQSHPRQAPLEDLTCTDSGWKQVYVWAFLLLSFFFLLAVVSCPFIILIKCSLVSWDANNIPLLWFSGLMSLAAGIVCAQVMHYHPLTHLPTRLFGEDPGNLRPNYPIWTMVIVGCTIVACIAFPLGLHDLFGSTLPPDLFATTTPAMIGYYVFCVLAFLLAAAALLAVSIREYRRMKALHSRHSRMGAAHPGLAGGSGPDADYAI